MRINGLIELRKKMAALRRSTQNKILRQSINAAAKPIRMAEKRNAPVASPTQTFGGLPVGPGRGLLKKAIGVKVGFGKKRDRVFAVIGARRGLKTLIGVSAAGKQVYMDPARYDRLMEKKFSWMKRAVDSTKSQTASILTSEISRRMQAEVAKLRARGK